MKVYLVSNEYEDNWRDLQAIFDSIEKATEFNNKENGGYGAISYFELNVPGEEYV
jgi:hypothetical protein